MIDVISIVAVAFLRIITAALFDTDKPMNHCSFIIRLLVIGHAIFTVGECSDDENDEEVFKFQVELIYNMWTGGSSQSDVNRTGWPLTDDTKTLRKMAIAAANFISFEIEDPSKTLSDHILSMSASWGNPSYPDKVQDDKYILFVYFKAKPRDMYIRAAGPPNEYSYIIMVEGFGFSWRSVYGMSPREYVFNVNLMETDPVQSANEKNLPWTIENVDLRNVYQQMEFLDMMLVCLMAKDHVSKQSSTLKPKTAPSPIGYHLLKWYNAKRGQFEEHVGYRCPIKPLLYVYFEDSKSVGVVVVA